MILRICPIELVLMLSISIVSCDEQIKNDEQLSHKITEAIQSSTSQYIRIDSLAQFDWEALYIVHPYISKEGISELNREVENVNDADLEMRTLSEGQSHLLFVKSNHIIKMVSISRYPCCDFLFKGQNDFYKYSKEDAVFMINKKIESGSLIYTLTKQQ